MFESELSIIPKPTSTSILSGKLNLKLIKHITLRNNSEPEKKCGKRFQTFLSGLNSLEFIGKNSSNINTIFIELDSASSIEDEGYSLKIEKNNSIELLASTSSGLFYGFQTFRQLCDSELERGIIKNPFVQNCEILDSPRFGYRGMHLDVSRHFFDVNFIKTYIDMIAFHKMNVFHWHLTDDNGWRIEIDKYPELTKKAAWRVDRRHEPWKEWSPIKKDEKATYGGFYTKDEIKEVVEYASDKHIKIIPEIEMPGHTSEVFSAYPELSCSGKYIPVNPGSYWPNLDIFCAGNDSVFTFLENILDEVIELFPGNYIHIGGDEADKTVWKKCPKCQKRIKDEGLKDENELQSWFIKRIERFILSKQKSLVGWDEILEGGLAKSATVMSWRGTKGGVDAAKLGHEVIMCPVTHCYFDYYQSDPEKAPKAFGGLITLKKVYSFNPIPKDLPEDKAHLILGGQGNLWTEYVQDREIAQYRVLPRMTALSEVLWSKSKDKTYERFYKRLMALQTRFDVLGWNYSNGSFDLDIKTFRNETSKELSVDLSSEKPSESIFYTLDGSKPTLKANKFHDTFLINSTTTIKAALFIDNIQAGKVLERTFNFHKAIGKSLYYNSEYSNRYPGSGVSNLINGVSGSKSYNDGKWQGWLEEDAEFIIDFYEGTNIESLSISFLESHDVSIFLPIQIELSFSNDNSVFNKKRLLAINQSTRKNKPNRKLIKVEKINVNCRCVQVNIKNQRFCPGWHKNSGEKSWLFIDEINIY
jgi:hexosaminidase